MSTPQARLATPLQASWQQAMGGGLAARPAASMAGPDAAPTGLTPLVWWRRSLRVLRDVAIGMALIASVPMAAVGVLGPPEWTSNSVRDRVVEVERVRSLSLPPDARIDPLAAGAALHRLAPPKPVERITLREVVPDALPWLDAPLDATLFEGRRSNWWPGPEAARVIDGAAAGYSAAELAWLERVATAPLWRDADIVARAPAIDIHGAMLATRLDPAAVSSFPPTAPVQRLRQIAEAGVARAAWHVSRREYAEADVALRTVVGLGFAFIDNGTSFLEALIGRVVVDIGRSGMRQLAAIDGRTDVYAVAAPFRSRMNGQRVPIAEREADAATNLADPSLSRAFRFEQYGLVAGSSCSSVKKMLLGLSDTDEAALAEARRTLPRFASERDMLDYTARRLDVLSAGVTPRHVLGAVVVGAAEVTSAITGNPRIASCTRLVTSTTR